jgi:hypothetical protein
MPWDMLRSPAIVDSLLMSLLLVWLGGSAVMTLLAGQAAQRHEANELRQREHRSAAGRPPAATQASGPIRS